MARIPAVLVLVALVFGALGCASTADAPTPTPTALGDSVAADAAPLRTASPDAITHLPLDLVAPGAAKLAEPLGEQIGIAVYYPSQKRMYEYNSHAQFELVSVVKVPIMMTVLDKAIQERRALTDDETYYLTLMISESDNDSTTELWNEIGGAPAVESFLDSAGVVGADIDTEDWGDSVMSAGGGAQLLGKLIEGKILDAKSRAFSMQLMSQIDPNQAWGATVASSFAAETGMKNGWYPEEDGWVLDSFGYALPHDGSPDYTIAIFSRGHADFDTGVNTIESIASLINTELLAR